MQTNPARPTHVRWGIFGLACSTSWLLYLHRYAFALIKPELSKEWHLDTQDLGLLASGFSGCYSVVQFPLGVATDYWGVHLVLTGMILAWTFGLGMHAWAESISGLVLGRAVLGTGQSAVYAALNHISRQWFP